MKKAILHISFIFNAFVIICSIHNKCSALHLIDGLLLLALNQSTYYKIRKLIRIDYDLHQEMISIPIAIQHNKKFALFKL